MSTAHQTQAPALLTAEQFALRPDPGHPEELVHGEILTMPPAGARHGKICSEIAFWIRLYFRDHDLGHVLTNDSGVITARKPDSVRGPDVSVYRYERLPRDAVPAGYPDVAPDLVFEVLSPDDRWPMVLAKVAEYLNVGVHTVVVVDPERRAAQVYTAEEPVRLLAEADELAVPAVLGDGFQIDLARLLA